MIPLDFPIMKQLAAFLFLPILPILASAADLPLHPDEAKIIQGIIATEAVEVEVADLPGYAKSGIFKTLEGYGVDVKSLKTSGIALKGKPQVVLAFVYDAGGHVVALHGNGPWLRNSTLRSFKGLPELLSIRIDHNGFVGNDPRIPEFDGSGFDALADSKLADSKIGLSFSDKGMEQCAKIKALRSFGVAHSRVTDAGVAFFAGHSELTSFSVSEMGKPLLTGKALASIAKIPNVNKIGFGECYITYTDGFAHLAPLKDRLVEFNITMSIASPADLDKFKADHPNMKITGLLTPEEIAKRHSGAAANIVKQAPPELAAPLKAAIEQLRKK